MIQSFIVSMTGYCLVLLPFYIGLRYFYMRNKPKKLVREFWLLLFFLYCVSIFSQTIIPNFYMQNGVLMFESVASYARSNLMPLHTINMYVQQLRGPLAEIAFYNLAGNIVLFIPFGFFIPILWRSLRSLKKMFGIALIIPIFIEGTQYFIGRSVDVDDVLLNTSAIIFGYLCFKIIYWSIKTVVNK